MFQQMQTLAQKQVDMFIYPVAIYQLYGLESFQRLTPLKLKLFRFVERKLRVNCSGPVTTEWISWNKQKKHSRL